MSNELPLLGEATRPFWVAALLRIAAPVLSTLARGELRKSLPVESQPGREMDRATYTHLEAFGRTLAGVAPWLSCAGLTGEEENRRLECVTWVHQALDHATDPTSPDFLNFTEGTQPLVDAAFLAQGLLRAPDQLWEPLPPTVRTRIVHYLKSTRAIMPGINNWLLFSAMVEAFLAFVGEDWDKMRVSYAIRQHAQWYKGDGAYGDGASFHWDYYNSFVIQPMTLDILRVLAPRTAMFEAFEEPVRRRATRYAAVLERLIAPDGTYPVLGRSICYRFGAFQLLAQAALLGLLPSQLPPPQVRCALTAVIHRTVSASGVFDGAGWLRIGLHGHQPALGERYISTGSLYLCLCGFLPLGLEVAHPFWSGPDMDWTSRRVWVADENLLADQSISDV